MRTKVVADKTKTTQRREGAARVDRMWAVTWNEGPLL